MKAIAAAANNTTNNLHVSIPKEVELEILAKLPVKSLMRFKCVSKPWKSTIENDPSFIALHFAHANAHPSLARILISFTGNNHLYTYSVSLDGGPATPHLALPSSGKRCWVSESFNGLVCYYNKVDVYICNPNTRQFKTLPRTWTGSDYLIYPSHHQTNFSFGFHPRTKEYKVVNLFLKQRGRSLKCPRTITLETFTLRTDSTTGQVFALHTDSWKTIHSSQSFYLYTGKDGVCVNGVIYWMGKQKAEERCGIVAFDLGCEEFRFITLPEGITITSPNLTKVRDCLAFFDGCWFKDLMEMWVFEEEYDNNNDNQLWIKEIFESPPPQYSWFGRPPRRYSWFVSPPRRYSRIRNPFCFGNVYIGEVLIKPFSVYDENIMISYHLKNKNVRTIEVSGLPDWIYGHQLRFINFSITNYVECLTPLR